MGASEIILAYRQSSNNELIPSLIPYFAFKPVENQEGELEDDNLAFRTEITEAFLYDFTKIDRPLIKAIFTEELKCEEETWRHDNLHQLCFYLYIIGDLEDVFDLYAAKYHATHMDVGCVLDRDMITLGHEVNKVIEFVTSKFDSDASLKEKYSKILWVLNDIKSEVYHSDGYTNFINQYYLGTKTD